MASMSHVNVVRYFGGQIVGKQFWIVMEYMECGTILDMMRILGLEYLGESIILAILRDILAGLSYLHGQGIIHKVCEHLPLGE